MTAERPSVLMATLTSSDDLNPINRELLDAVSESIEAIPFRWRTAVGGRYDLVHGQWIEQLVRDENVIKAAAKAIIGCLWLRMLSRGRVPLIETIHNLRPHEPPGWWAKQFLRRWQRLPKLQIFINESSQNDLSTGLVILHPRYSIDGSLVGATRTNDVLSFGLIRRYKHLETLCHAFQNVPGPTSLRIVGQPVDESYAEELRNECAKLPQASTRFERLTADDLQAEITKACGVALPYANMYNSGAAILALSAGTRVLLPSTASNEALQAEFGHSWVTLFKGEVSATDLISFVSNNRVSPSDTEQREKALLNRSWSVLGYLYSQLYQTLARTMDPATARRSLSHDAAFTSHSKRNCAAL